MEVGQVYRWLFLSRAAPSVGWFFVNLKTGTCHFSSAGGPYALCLRAIICLHRLRKDMRPRRKFTV